MSGMRGKEGKISRIKEGRGEKRVSEWKGGRT